MRHYTRFVLFIVLMFVSGSFSSAEEYIQAQCEIGIETAVSGGRYTVSQVAQIAGKNGVDVVITADAFLNRWQYGLWPLRSIIKKTEQTRSIFTFGLKRYLDEIKAAEQQNPGMVIIGGFEAAPFYCWEGNPFKNNFAIKDWHKHLIVIGLEDWKSWKRLPVMGNTAGLVKPFGIKGLLLLLLSVVIVAAGLFCVRESMRARKDVYESRYGLLLEHWRYVGIALILLSLFVFVNGYPFRDLKYDQYRGNCGIMPYQNLIDYVKEHGGMTFWSHPEAKNIEQIGKVSIQTGEHTDLLLETCGYTGFAIFYEGYDLVGRPQGIWDSVLRRYCQGGCSSPVWAIGMLDYDTGRDLGKEMQNLRTVLLVKEKSRAGALEAMKRGRMYVAEGADASRFRLNDFTVGDISGVSAMMGQEIVLMGAPRVRIKGDYTAGQAVKAPLKIFLIRDGEILTVFEKEAPFDITYDDEDAEKTGKHYYRAEIRSAGLTIITNPVFVERK